MEALVKKYNEKSKVFLKEKFTRDGAGWLLAQQLIIAPMALITTVLLARILSISNYSGSIKTSFIFTNFLIS